MTLLMTSAPLVFAALAYDFFLSSISLVFFLLPLNLLVTSIQIFLQMRVEQPYWSEGVVRQVSHLLRTIFP